MATFFRRLFAGSGATVDAAEARRRQADGALLIDVREPDEWTEGHAPAARLIPLGQLDRCLDTLPREGELLLICRSGGRSGSAAAMLRRAGFERVLNVSGGMLAWQRANLPIVRG